MEMIGRNAQQRAVLFRDRFARFCRERGVTVLDADIDQFRDQILEAFLAAEQFGEQRGLVKGQALSKLTDAERTALGF